MKKSDSFRVAEFPNLRSACVPHEPVDIDFSGEPSRTVQEFAEDCDINTIMARFERTGVMPMDGSREPVYYDFTTMPTNLMESLDIMRLGEEAFMGLPATVRREFDNDPRMFLDFASDPENLSQMQSWGLAPPPAKPAEPMAVRIVGDPAPAPVAPGEPPKPA